MRDIVPVKMLGQRMPEQGRIRIGNKASGRPNKLSKFRFTSHDESAIHEIATHYGGQPKPWTDGPRQGEWEVITTSKEIKVALPPDPLGDSPIYEEWSGGGCLRRCDGEQCQMPQQTEQGAEITTAPCLCRAEGAMKCKPKTRLTVILRGVRFGGGWRLETGGWNAAQEMPGMVEMIQSLQQRGVTRGILTLAERKSIVIVKSKPTTVKFVVPALALDQDIDQLAAGAASMGALAPAPTPALVAPAEEPERYNEIVDVPYDDGVVVDAEIIDITPHSEAADTPPTDAKPARKRSADPLQTVLVIRVQELAEKEKLDSTELRHAFANTVSKGATDSTSKLEREDKQRILKVLDEIDDGTVQFTGISDGKVGIKR